MRKRKTVLHDRQGRRFQFYCYMMVLFVGLAGSLGAEETDRIFKAGLSLKNAEKYQEAITEYRKIVDNKKADIKDRINAINQIGEILFINLKNDTEAKRYFALAKTIKAQEEKKNNPHEVFKNIYQKGRKLIAKRDYAAAEALYRKYLKRKDITKKQRALMLMNIGHLLRIQKKYPKSLVEYRKASVEGGDTESIAMVWVAKVNICMKEYDAAWTVCQKITSSGRFNAAQKLEGYAVMTELQMAQKDFSGAHKTLAEAAEKISKAKNAASIIARKRGMVYEAEGKYQDAIKEYRKAAEDKTLDKSLRASAYSSIASIAFRKLSDRTTALENLDKAKELKSAWGYDSNLHNQLNNIK